MDNLHIKEANPHNNSWQSLFSPRSVAVIGATNTPGSWGYGATRRLLDSSQRQIFPVNTAVSEVLGIATYHSVVDIPEPVDLAVIVVPARQVPAVSRQCVEKGVRAAVIISSGFAETGESGQKMERDLVEIARQGGMRFIGPNSMGHADTGSHLLTVPWMKEISPGPVSLISQSGYYGEHILYSGMASGIGFSKFISSGNEADLHLEDYLEYLAQDENTKVIAAYIEGLREGRRFFRLAKEATARKPVIVIKSGSTQESARAARSHTGSLAGSEEVYQAAFKQSGVMRVNNDDEMCDLAVPLLNQPLPRGNRVAILTIGGGLGVAASEDCEKAGLVMARLAASTMEKLNDYLPPRWSHGNPVDVAGMNLSRRKYIYASLQALMEDENVDAVLFCSPMILSSYWIATVLEFSAQEIHAFQEAQKERMGLVKQWVKEYGKPVLMVSAANDPEAYSYVRGQGIPVYSNSHRAVRSLQNLVCYRDYLDSRAT